MGTYMTDALEFDLLTGADLATDATDTGDVVEVDWVQEVTFVLDTGTVTGVNSIVLQGCETSDFTTADVVTFADWVLTATDDDVVYELTTRVTSKFLRASVTIGTGGDLSGSTLKVRPVHWLRTRLNSAHALA